MSYHALLSVVKGRGVPPAAFLDTFLSWARTAPDEIFMPNAESGDVMGRLSELLGPWQGDETTAEGKAKRLLHRKCCMLELLRCLAGFESSWKWDCGVDTTNSRSKANVQCQETGIFQVSYDSLYLERSGRTLRDLLARKGVKKVKGFIAAMKSDHELALEYAARLLRINFQWDGPIKRREIDSSLSRAAVEEFKQRLS
jgi:hypothetical protein